jgi:thiol-disulfide isomerase/thioredoxin
MRMISGTCVAGLTLGLLVPVGPGFGSSEARDAAPAIERSDPNAGAELLGTPAPEWSFDRWLGSPPLSLAHLRGKVVLLRWWTEGCSYCAATLPGLEELRRRDGGPGLVVIGVYHPKPPREVSDRHILGAAKRLGFAGPIAVDERWSMLDRYWLGGHPERDWTSVSFLIDRHAACAIRYRDLERAIATALAGDAPATRSLR